VSGRARVALAAATIAAAAAAAGAVAVVSLAPAGAVVAGSAPSTIAPAAAVVPLAPAARASASAPGTVAPGGRYRVRLRAPDGTARNVGALTLRSHIYPIRGRHADRGPAGAFGVGRSGGARTRASTSTPRVGRRSSPPAAGSSGESATTRPCTATS
jgi:hypothetical protein